MTSKWLIALLVVSLGVNLATLGFYLGRQTTPDPSFDPTRHYPRWARSLPADRSEALRPILRRHFQELRPAVRTLRERYREMHAAIVANPFEPERLTRSLNAIRAGMATTQALSHISFVSFVTELTPAERQALARDLMRPKRPRKNGPERPPLR